MFKKTIGILGGMGPVASADTYVNITKICQQNYGAVQDSDFPAIILYSLPLREFTHEGFSENSAEQKLTIEGLSKALGVLENAGAEIILMDCNTIHYFFKILQKSVNVPIVNLIEVTSDNIKENNYNKIAVICSQVSKDIGLYSVPLGELGLEVFNTSESEQEFVNDVILAVMGGTVNSAHISGLNRIIKRFGKDGAQKIILGCTEISNLAKNLENGELFIDSELLAINKAILLAK